MNKETEMVRNLYAGMVDREWNRLDQDEFHRLEYRTTWRFLQKYLPSSGLILDAGGGPGRYTIDLARNGYGVVLLDLVKENLARARQEIERAGVGDNVKQTFEGTITDLSLFSDKSFDAVCCLGGPLSHVHPESERLKATSELIRVLKPGSRLFVSVISRYGVLLATPEGWPSAVTNPRENFPLLYRTGDNYNFVNAAFCHFFTLPELEGLFTRQRVKVLERVGLEGLNTDEKTSNEFAAKYPDAWQKWLEIHEECCTDPFVVNASGHMMIILEKE